MSARRKKSGKKGEPLPVTAETVASEKDTNGRDPTDRYPLDFAALERGSCISEDEIRRMFEIHPEKLVGENAIKAQSRLELRKLQLRRAIEGYFAKERGDIVTVSGSGQEGGLKILTAPDQDKDSVLRQERAMRKLADAVMRDRGNDPLGLTEKQRTIRDDRIVLQSWRLQQLRKRPPPALTGEVEENGQ